jgi:amino acid transporter
MKTLLDYIYYRIAKAYRTLDGKDYYIYGSLVLFGTLGFIFLSLLAFVFYLTQNKINAYVFGAIMGVFAITSFFFFNKKRYAKLEELYNDEKHSKLKGWLVFCYVIGSFLWFCVSIHIFKV